MYRRRTAVFMQLFVLSLIVFGLIGYQNWKLEERKPNTQIKVIMDVTRTPLLKECEFWTILMTVNHGFLDFFINWLLHFKKLGLICPLIVMTHDEHTFNLLRSNQSLYGRLSVIKSEGANVTSAATYNTKNFANIVSERPRFILDHLSKGFNVLYVDADTVWLSSPFQHFNGKFDMWIQLDLVAYCTGFMAIKSNMRTISLFKQWRDSLSMPNRKQTNVNQPVFNHVAATFIRSMNLTIKSLDPKLFPDGHRYFDVYNSEQRKDVVAVHNNFITGYKNKLRRFKRYGLWLLDF